MRIDAHQHYWKISRGDYGWITPDIPVLYRDFLPEHLAPHLRDHDIDGSVVVQAAPTLEETDYILTLAEAEPAILGVVGWLDLFDPRHREHFESFRSRPKFVGFRIMIQEMPDANRILAPEFVNALRGYAEEGVPIDLLVRSSQLEPTLNLLRQVPGLRAVIDHIAKPDIRSGVFTPWSEQIRELARFPGLFCKLSGMVTEADPERWRPEDFVPYVRLAAEAFGPDRVMFGSDWPVCLMAAEYDEAMDVLLRSLPDAWGEEEKAKLFGLNAKEFYRL
ncbi:amidohydrolase family protein [Cohnella caldifontis]|uniref:amidohydrolase family protein n=1 Tax=Cohnella caldifontis TaxID=3027471 RepID=UPI0023EB3567|nr:amidohydrolase family protein [Cohnella sp. YIM B05605]